MAPKTTAQEALLREEIRIFHGALLEIVSVINRPQGDDKLVREAGIPLDRALFPLLVVIERFGPIGIVDLAGRVGRDHTTVSRQVAKLESLGLAQRQASAADRRIREVAVTPKGKTMTGKVDEARERLGREIFASWDEREVKEFIRLTRKFADAVKDEGGGHRNSGETPQPSIPADR